MTAQLPHNLGSANTGLFFGFRVSNVALGMGMLALAHVIFSTQDVIIKLLADHYPVHELVMARSLIAVWPMILMSWIIDQGRGLQLSRPGWQLVRALILATSFTTYCVHVYASRKVRVTRTRGHH